MNIQHNEALLERLAATYVLGTLKGGARRRFEKMAAQQLLVRRAIAEWQDRLNPLAQFAKPVAPAPAVWLGIEQRLGLRRVATQDRFAFWRNLRNDLSFWRGLGLSSTAVAAILIAVLVGRQPEMVAPSATDYIATLADDKAQPILLITGDAAHHQMIVKIVARQTIAADKSLELWALAKDGQPRSLGLVNADGMVTLPLPENATPKSIPWLAVSLEPKGGSPKPWPTGSVLYKGAWLQI